MPYPSGELRVLIKNQRREMPVRQQDNWKSVIEIEKAKLK